MKQVVQEVQTGVTGVREIPAPVAGVGQLVVANVSSLISAGTERYVVDLARKSLLGKARERPDQVMRVLQKIRAEGLGTTIQQVRAKLDEPMPLGYSTAGLVLECGRGASEFKPGDRVATAGPHAGLVSIGKNLCARIPEGVSFEQAAYTSVATIGLEGVRLAKVTLGERVLVIGLGLIGQICIAILKAQGCRVFGLDVDPAKLELARQFGADAVAVGSPADAIKAFGGGIGVDAVVITAATPSNAPIELAAEVTRPHGRIVLVGVVGLNLPRPPFFQKELEFTVSGSLGPGRWDPNYEEKGIDYPLGLVRWTAQRNMEAVLDLIAAGKLPVEKLTSHRFPIDRAAEAYDLITAQKEPFLGVLLEYPEEARTPIRRVELKAQPAVGKLGISMIGAGNFARLMLLPELERIGGFTLRGLGTAKGLSAQHTGTGKGFAFATTDAAELWKDAETNAVFIATRHDLHAELVIAALKAGKHVFVEKPLCLTVQELDQISATVRELGASCPILMVGFNRRFAPATATARSFLAGAGPLSVSYRFSPGPIPPEHWTQDEEIGGGRIVGEACHAIDTCSALIGSPPVKVFAESVAREGGLQTTDDCVFITLRHADGSISSVSYQAGGDKGFPSERIEMFGGGRTVVIDAWDEISLWNKGKAAKARGGKDKGHHAELEAFLGACKRGGAWPIPWEQLHGVTEATCLAVQSLRQGMPLECLGPAA
jgi:predicted dehydrogenase